MAIGVFLEEMTDNFLKKIGGQRYKFLFYFFFYIVSLSSRITLYKKFY